MSERHYASLVGGGSRYDNEFDMYKAIIMVGGYVFKVQVTTVTTRSRGCPAAEKSQEK
jgi:hypothetical protein